MVILSQRASLMMLLNGLIDTPTIASSSMAGEAMQDSERDRGKALIDFANPAENLKAFVKLTASLDPTVQNVGWFGGTIYAVIGDDQKVQPLIGVEGCGVTRVEPRGDNVYRMFNREFAVYKDLSSGRYLDRWHNPLIDETVDVLPIQNLTVNAEIAPITKQDFDGTMVESPFTPPWIVQQGTAFSLLEVHTAFPNPMTPKEWPRESAGPVNRTSEMFNRAASYAELADPGLPHVYSTGTWVRVSPWLPWMLMGQRKGHLMYRTFMQRTGSASSLPPQLFNYMSKYFPDFLSAPSPNSWGSPNDSSFLVYMKKRSPAPTRNR